MSEYRQAPEKCQQCGITYGTSWTSACPFCGHDKRLPASTGCLTIILVMILGMIIVMGLLF